MFARIRLARLMMLAMPTATLLGACGGSAVGTPAVTPLPAPVVSERIPEPSRRVLRLPSRIATTSWQVTTTASLRASGADQAEQRMTSRALVSWTFERASDGSLRGTGQVDSLTFQSTLDSARTLPSVARGNVNSTPRPSLLLLDAFVDSLSRRVVTRPPLVNECDRPELAAVALARDVLVRIPDGLTVGDQWRDSTVSFVCRMGVPITIYTTALSEVERLDPDHLLIKRTVSGTLEGKGGSAFRAFEVNGTSAGSQRLRIHPVSGVLENLEGSSTLTLLVTERTPSGMPQTERVVQQTTLNAKRVAR